MSDTVTIWHNPKCSTSRNALALIRDAGIDPVVRDYQKDPPSVAEIRAALDALGIPARDLIRQKGTPYAELGLGDPGLSDDDLIAAMAAHPILIQRPVVFSARGAVIARPIEAVRKVLP
ncbi:MAG: arsenate reductase (glutaredoxin) [Paracoccus sp. (in: a-proteobacteria)]|uniref:arsenate reductase (glutaredoxin) n=1 Tax=Paracoccus sp. TaxID=267 RepID=UPI0026DEBCE2|nr:arsenate reductase (glutaredoxin) [Paracoccus sp. (in: a-proteobacteria)]MDO5632866.1 arsenate reductase (glutaredoxin) [Paracoccus sp. (in: a-proteobacteria)]